MGNKEDFTFSPQHEKMLGDFLTTITRFRDSLPNQERDTIETETAFLQKILATHIPVHGEQPPSDLSLSAHSSPLPDE